jgi:uncharacterized phage protein (TIGR01671 family)
MEEIKFFRGFNQIEDKFEYWTLNDLCYNSNRPDLVVQELQQYTGLKDKKGTKIFEGDILEYIYIIGKLKTKKIGVVRFDGGRFEVGNHNGYGGEWDSIDNSMEIIGNIYENENLLK